MLRIEIDAVTKNSERQESEIARLKNVEERLQLAMTEQERLRHELATKGRETANLEGDIKHLTSQI